MAYDPKRRQKVARREVYTAEPATPAFLRWSESTITFDRADHPGTVPHPGRYPVVVDPIVGPKRLTKVLMDGGSGLNILYVDTLDAMRIPWSELRPVSSPLYGVISGCRSTRSGRLTYPSCLATELTSARRYSPSRWWTS